jgi:iron complex transport system substrate-binding protein
MKKYKIATMLPSATEIVFGLGLGDMVIGTSHECDFPKEAKDLPTLTSASIDSTKSSREIHEQVNRLGLSALSLYHVDEELMVQLKPDVIITQDACDVCAVNFSEVERVVRKAFQNDCRIVALSPSNLNEIFQDIRNVAKALDVEDRGERYVAELTARMDALRAKSETLPDRPRTAHVEWLDPLITGAHWMYEMIELCGGTPVASEQGKASKIFDAKWFAELDPEVIVIAPCGFPIPQIMREANEFIHNLPDGPSLSAVRNHRVYVVDGNQYFNRPGPRIVDSAEILAHCVHPEVFPLPESYRDSVFLLDVGQSAVPR